MKHDLLSSEILVSKFEERKGRHLDSLRHCIQSTYPPTWGVL